MRHQPAALVRQNEAQRLTLLTTPATGVRYLQKGHGAFRIDGVYHQREGEMFIHLKPLHPSHPVSIRLPHNDYGALVGTIDGPLSDADDNHVFIFVRLSKGKYAGRYKLAFNTESNQGHVPVEFYVYDEPISMAEVPGEGFTTDASLSYAGIGLHQSDFRKVVNGKLRTIVHDSAQDSDLVEAYGVTFGDGTGVHDLHHNNGEPAKSKFPNHPNQDGALAFYYLNRTGQTTRRWIFIKFQTQSLP